MSWTQYHSHQHKMAVLILWIWRQILVEWDWTYYLGCFPLVMEVLWLFEILLKVFFCSQYASTDPRQRRASDGLLCVVKETSSDMVPPRGHRSPLLSYKTEPGAGKTSNLLPQVNKLQSLWIQAHNLSPLLDHSFTYVNEKNDYDTKETCRVPRNGHNRCVIAIKSNICPRANWK